MAQLSLEQPTKKPVDPFDAAASEFHQNIVVANPNFRSTPRWSQEEQAANFLKGVSPTFAQINPNSPAYRYQVTQLLDKSLPMSTTEQVQGLAEDLGPAALATGGALLAGGPATAGPALGAAALGGALGSFIPQLRPLTTGAPPPTVSSSMLEAGKNAAMFPLVDLAAGKALEGGAALGRKMFVPGANEPGRQMGLEAIREFGGIPGMTQRGAGPMIQFMENIGEAAIPMRGMAARRQETVNDAVGAMAIDLAKQITPILRSDADMSKVFFQETQNLRRFYQAAVHQKYQVVDELTQKGVTVNTRPATALVADESSPITKSIMDQFEAPEIIDRATGNVSQMGFRGRGGVEATNNGFLDLANTIGGGKASFSDTQRMSSALRQIQRSNPDFPGLNSTDRVAGRRAGEMADHLDREMDKAADAFTAQQVQSLTKAGIPLVQAQAQVGSFSGKYHDAKAYYKRNIADRFETEVYRRLADHLKDEPAKFSRLAIAADSPGKLDALRKAAPRLWPQMQARIYTSIVEDSVKLRAVGMGEELSEVVARGAVKEFDSEKLIKKFATLGPEYTRKLSGGALSLHNIQRLGSAMEVANQRPIGQGKVIVALTEGTAAVNMALMPFGAGAPGVGFGKTALIMLSPNLLSLVFSRPALLNMMERGLVDGPKSRAFAKFNAFLFSQQMTDMREQQRSLDRLHQTNLLPKPIAPQLSMPPSLPPPLPQVPLPPSLRQEPPLLQRPPRM